MAEYNVEVDINDNVIGFRPRTDFYTGNYIHRASHLILLNSKDEVLIQKRSPNKIWHPNKYTYSTSGTVSDESYEENMAREVFEEIGIRPKTQYLFKFYEKVGIVNAYNAVFFARSDDKITFDKGEMSLVEWVPIRDLEQRIQKTPEIFVDAFVTGMTKFLKEYYGKI